MFSLRTQSKTYVSIYNRALNISNPTYFPSSMPFSDSTYSAISSTPLALLFRVHALSLSTRGHPAELSCPLLSILRMTVHPLRQQKTYSLSNLSLYLQNEFLCSLHFNGLRTLSTNPIYSLLTSQRTTWGGDSILVPAQHLLCVGR